MHAFILCKTNTCIYESRGLADKVPCGGAYLPGFESLIRHGVLAFFLNIFQDLISAILSVRIYQCLHQCFEENEYLYIHAPHFFMKTCRRPGSFGRQERLVRILPRQVAVLPKLLIQHGGRAALRHTHTHMEAAHRHTPS